MILTILLLLGSFTIITYSRINHFIDNLATDTHPASTQNNPSMIRPGDRFGRGPHRILRRPPVDYPEPEYVQRHEPTPSDCAAVKHIIATASEFPPEIVDMVMDAARYWVCSITSVDFANSRSPNIYGGSRSEDTMLLRTLPLGLTRWRPTDEKQWREVAPPRRLETEFAAEDFERFVEGPMPSSQHPCREIAFDIVSRDQGGGGSDRNEYSGSNTWFDAGVDCFDKGRESLFGQPPSTQTLRSRWPPLEEDKEKYYYALHADEAHLVQRNRHPCDGFTHHQVVWNWKDNVDPVSEEAERLAEAGRGRATGNGAFVRDLKVGDMLTVWGRARYLAWQNRVQKLEVRVYWAI